MRFPSLCFYSRKTRGSETAQLLILSSQWKCRELGPSPSFPLGCHCPGGSPGQQPPNSLGTRQGSRFLSSYADLQIGSCTKKPSIGFPSLLGFTNHRCPHSSLCPVPCHSRGEIWPLGGCKCGASQVEGGVLSEDRRLYVGSDLWEPVWGHPCPTLGRLPHHTERGTKAITLTAPDHTVNQAWL